MSDGQNRSEPPTPHRLREARKRGDVAISRELVGAAILGGAALLLAQLGTTLGESMSHAARSAWKLAGDESLAPVARFTESLAAFATPLLLVVSLICALAAVAAFVSFVQVGPLLAWSALRPKLSHLNPAAGIKRMFFQAQSYVELIRSLLKLTIAAWIVWSSLRDEIATLLTLGRADPTDAAAWIGGVLSGIVRSLVIFWLVLGAIDLLYQRWLWVRRNRMSREEVRREHEDNEGKPEHRAERKRLHREIAESRMLADSHEATVMLANPTHLVVAMRYDPARDHAPRIIAKGTGDLARRLKQIARDERIPLQHNIALARALYRLEVNALIPETLYDAVRCVLLWVEEVAQAQGRSVPWNADDAPSAAAPASDAPPNPGH